MNAYRNIAVIAIVAFACAILAPNASAQIPIEKLSVTISEPVEVPGLVLPIGTYVFEALENGRLTRILNADESHVYATLLTQPDERRMPVDSPAITFKETQKGAVERIDAWFFADESIGSEFLYPGTPVDDVMALPEYLVVHAERAVVNTSIATGRFFRANFLVN